MLFVRYVRLLGVVDQVSLCVSTQWRQPSFKGICSGLT